MKKSKTQKGITLIALIITIVVLLILAAVTINAIQGDGILQYAKNAADEYTAKADEEQETINTLLGQIEGSLSEKEKITWTKTSEGVLAIGSTVKTSTNEEFYVIGGDTVGTSITNKTQNVILLAKYNLKADGSAQDLTGASNPCAFCTETAWNGASVADNDDLNTKATIKEDTSSAVYKAMKYGESLGVTTGRLMLESEAQELESANSHILYGSDYWLGSASGSRYVSSLQDDGDWDSREYFDEGRFGVRPVVEISISAIEGIVIEEMSSLAIGDEVAINGEYFYAIGGDTVGTRITSSTEKVILLAKYNLKADGSAQDITGASNNCAFCTETAWNGASVKYDDDLNTKATIKKDTTSAVYKAIKYGESLGVTTGRLMLYSEAIKLENSNSNILYGINENLSYWLGSASDSDQVYYVAAGNIEDQRYNFNIDGVFLMGVRPVIEISISDIS